MPEMPDVVTLTTISSDWGNDIRDRTVQRYSSVANRTSEHASPAEGDLSYLEDSNTVWVYNGSAWVQLVPGPVATANIADGAVTWPKLSLDWTVSSPGFGNVTPGTGFASSLEYILIGKTVICRGHFVLGTGGDVAGTVTLTLPVTAATAELNTPIGLCRMFDGAVFFMGQVELTSTTACKFVTLTVDGGFVRPITVGATNPFDWGNSDALYFQFTYEAA